VEAKYCTYPNATPHQELFNPLDPNSVKLTYYSDEAGGGVIPVCRVNPATIDNDYVMNLALQNPNASYNTIVNVCNTSIREGTDLSGTKLGDVCNKYQQNMQQLRR